MKALEEIGISVGDIACRTKQMTWEVRRALYDEPTPLCKEARKELVALYVDETAPQLARRYRTTESQVHAAWAGRDPQKLADPDLVLLIWNECQDIRDTAKVLGLAVATVRSALAKRGVVMTTTKLLRRNKFTVQRRDEQILYDLEHSGLTHQQIADKYDVHRAYVSKMNPNRRRYKSVDIPGVLQDLKIGYSKAEIARRRGVSRSAIYKLLQEE